MAAINIWPSEQHVKQSFNSFPLSLFLSLFRLISNSFQWFYYFGIIEDLILRFSWTLSMSLIQAGYIEGDVMMTILSPLEVFRRFIWNYFRLENEHLNNVGKFRAVRDISVAPMDCSDQVAATSPHSGYVLSIYIYYLYILFVYANNRPQFCA